jgi:iron(III) transport system permease protein
LVSATDIKAAIVIGATQAQTQGLKPALSSDQKVQRSLVWLVVLYLLVTLVLPLTMVFVKAMQTYQFAVADIAVSMQRDDQWSEPRSLATWLQDGQDQLNREPSERSREQITKIIPKSERRDVQMFALQDNSAHGGLLLIEGNLSEPGQRVEIEPSRLSSVQIKPVMHYSLGNFNTYFSNPVLTQSIGNSIWVAVLVVLIVIPLAFAFAYGLTRTCMPLKSSFRLIATIPVLIPSLLPGIGLVYLFGEQGILKSWLMGESLYGPIGIVMASAFFTFPHALIIMVIALSTTDQRLYEAAQVLGASKWRTFRMVTIPGARYGIVSAIFVVFTLVITDFGVPKVVGGDFNVLALDIYKQVVGQQNFQIGAVVSLILLLPSVLAFTVDRINARKQVALMSAKAVPYVPQRDLLRDFSVTTICALISIYILGLLLMCQAAAVIKFWPYDLSISFRHFEFDRMDGGGWRSFYNSLFMAACAATIGGALIFLGAYLTEKMRASNVMRATLHMMAMIPMAVPGMVLGLAFIFFFNNPENPLYFLYGTMAILVINTISHLYTVPHISAVTALKQLDAEFESVAMSLKQPFWRSMTRVTVPVCAPALGEIWLYIFVNAMTTVSAVVFLYSPTTQLASVAVLNMDDAGDIAPAAAMGMMIFYSNVMARLIYYGIIARYFRKGQRWRATS